MTTAVVSRRRRPCATVSSMRLCSFMIFDSSTGETFKESDMGMLLGRPEASDMNRLWEVL